MAKNDKINWVIAIITVVLTLVGTVIAAYFGFLGNSEPTGDIINATQTAEAASKSIFSFDFDAGISPWYTLGKVESASGKTGKGVIVTSRETGKSELWLTLPATYFEENKIYSVTIWYKAPEKTYCTLIFAASMGGDPYKEVTIEGNNQWQEASLELAMKPFI